MKGQSFVNALFREANPYPTVTENGARGEATSGHPLLDFYFQLPSMRTMESGKLFAKWQAGFDENPTLALRLLFYIRDTRGGMGEKAIFQHLMQELARQAPRVAQVLYPLIPEYGYFKDFRPLMDTDLRNGVMKLYGDQLRADMRAMRAGKPMSLAAKWAPSVNTSSQDTRLYGRMLAEAMGLTERQYRKMLAEMRKHLNVTEVLMSEGHWADIDYAKVPSVAMKRYRKAFGAKDSDRFTAFLAAVEKGETKINASVLFPYEIAAAYGADNEQGCGWGYIAAIDRALEAQWKALPDYVNGADDILWVLDGSGSMCSRIDGSDSITLHTAAMATTIYSSERMTGPLRDKLITFSAHPKFIDLAGCNSLQDKLNRVMKYDECANTNIEATFDLVLNTAVRNHFRQEDLPGVIGIVSDMHFDAARGVSYWRSNEPSEETLFDTIKQKWQAAGYTMPRLLFWNMSNRPTVIPVKQNPSGLILASGFSPVVLKMVLSGKLDPFDVLREQLMAPRYDAVETALQTLRG